MTDRNERMIASPVLFALVCMGLLVAPGRLRAGWAGRTDWKPVEYTPGGDVIYFDHVPQSTNPEIRAHFSAAAESLDASSYLGALAELEKAIPLAKGSELAALHNITAYVNLWCHLTSDASISSLEASLDVAAKAGDSVGRAAALSELGNLHGTYDRDFDTALSCLSKALAINQKAGLLEGVSFDQRLIGFCLHEQGQYDSALSHYQSALAAATSVNNYADIVSVRASIAHLYVVKDDDADALSNYLQAWADVPKAGVYDSTEVLREALRGYLEVMGADTFSAACKKQGFSQTEADALVAELQKTE
ncbi:MAG TPA: tetratricopeptide repeat protein [bacterium]|nr:tetratricopeptide repeat protein [bacterium]